MALKFANIPVNAANGFKPPAGASVDISDLGPNRTITVDDDGDFTGLLQVEASTNNANFTPIARFDSTSQRKLSIPFAAKWVRVQRMNVNGGSTPVINIGAEESGAFVFGTLPVPAGDGVGAAVDVSAGGDLISIFTDGTFDRAVFIEGSQDAGATFSRIEDFGKFESSRWHTLQLSSYDRLRVRSIQTRGNDSPVVMFGSMQTAGAGSPSAFLQKRNYFANQLTLPTVGWPITNPAPADPDAATSSIVRREFDPQGDPTFPQIIGFYERVPAGATVWRPQIVWRTDQAQTGGKVIGWQFHYLTIPEDPTAVPAWASLPGSLTIVANGTTNWFYQDEGPFNIGNAAGEIDVVPNRDVIIALTRTATGEPPDVVGVASLLEIQSEWGT